MQRFAGQKAYAMLQQMPPDARIIVQMALRLTHLCRGTSTFCPFAHNFLHKKMK